MDSVAPRWLRPTSLADALAERSRLADEAQVVGGGVWVTLLLQQGLIAPGTFLALDRVGELGELGLDADGALRLGAGVRMSVVARDERVRAGWPVLAETYAVVANERVRNQGTVGGNLAEADYASDPPCTLVALDATARLANADGVREMPVRDLLVGHYETAIAPDELIVEVRVPPLPPRSGGHYLKFTSRSSEDRPCAGVAAVATLDANGRCARLAVVIGAIAGTPVSFPEVTTQALGEQLTDDVLRAVADGYAERVDPLGDLRGSPEYRRQLVRTLVPRAIRQALGQIRGDT